MPQQVTSGGFRISAHYPAHVDTRGGQVSVIVMLQGQPTGRLLSYELAADGTDL